jgi:shikimate kinase
VPATVPDQVIATSDGGISVRRLTGADRRAAAAVVIAAFERDPVTRYVLSGDRPGYERRLRAFVAAGLDLHLSLQQPIIGVADQETLVGVALLTEPEARLTTRRLLAWFGRIAATAGPGTLRRFIHQERERQYFKPASRHHILSSIGVLPEYQGRGYGGVLLAAVHELAHAHPSSTGVVLDTSNGRSVALYRSVGYKVCGRVRVGSTSETVMFRPNHPYNVPGYRARHDGNGTRGARTTGDRGESEGVRRPPTSPTSEAEPRKRLPASRNVVLIGMPGCGKSTVGVLLAKRLSRSFIDTDVEIQTAEGCSLEALVETRGTDEFRETEERYVFSLSGRGRVIAAGGSIVYSERAMKRLARDAVVVFLDTELRMLERRRGDDGSNALVRRPGQSIADLFVERVPLYRRYADVTIDCRDRDQEAIAERIAKALDA